MAPSFFCFCSAGTLFYWTVLPNSGKRCPHQPLFSILVMPGHRHIQQYSLLISYLIVPSSRRLRLTLIPLSNLVDTCIHPVCPISVLANGTTTFLSFFIFLAPFKDTMSLCSSGWSGTYREQPVLAIKVYTLISSTYFVVYQKTKTPETS